MMLRFLRSKKPLRPFQSKLSERNSKTFSAAAAATETAAPSLTLHFLEHSCGLSADAARYAAERIHLKTTKNAHSVLALLKSYGFSKPQIADLVDRRPRLLLSSPDAILKPKLDFYRSLGLSSAELPKVISSRPGLLLWSLESRLEPSVKLLKSILRDDAKVFQVVKNSASSGLFSVDLHGILLSRLQALKDHGVPEPAILTLLKNNNKALIEPHDCFEESIESIKNLGISPSSTMFSRALRVLAEVPRSAWERKLNNFKSLGWSEEQVLLAFKRHPYCMSASDEKVRANMQFFSEKLNWGPDYVSRNPVLLSLSLEKRVMPRCLVLSILASKGLRKDNVFATHLMIGDKKFQSRYVADNWRTIPELIGLLDKEHKDEEFNE